LNNLAASEKAFNDAIAAFTQRRSLKRLGECLVKYSELLAKMGKKDEAKAALAEGNHLKSVSEPLSRCDDIFPSTLLRA
jgi:hypothetical protein